MSTRIAIVAGAGSGLGQATALALHAAGYTVVAVDRSESGLNELPDAITHREVADATDPAVPVPLVDKIATEVGAPNVLVNTIGAFELSDALSATPGGLRALTDVNVGAALWLTQAVAPHMERDGTGAIVHITARPGIEPTAGYAAYGVSKAALAHLIRILELELRPKGIRVNAVAPQVIATAKNKAMFPPEALAGAVEPEAIANVHGMQVAVGQGPPWLPRFHRAVATREPGPGSAPKRRNLHDLVPEQL